MAIDDFDSHKEPDVVFLPLSDDRYSRFYAMEMAAFHDDLPFYQQRIKPSDSVLELGCGAGRLCRQLTVIGARFTGIDRSLPMLRIARQKSGSDISYLCMDMTMLAFCPLHRQFDAAIIPYNTLNLLTTGERIKKSLQEIQTILKKNGRLLLQIFVPDQTILNLGSRKLFQFQIFEQPDGGRIIKEIRRGFHFEQITLEERYRVRPSQSGAANEDLSHIQNLAAFSLKKWRALFHESGFIIKQQLSGYNLTPFIEGRDTCLFIEATSAEH
jgi:SAM-dependent methyltransferase